MLTVSVTKRLNDFQLDVSFSVEREILVLFGPSGAGKTLTLQCIAGFHLPDRGRIELDGESIFESDGRKRRQLPVHRRRLGYVFQEYALFPHMTVLQNILYGARGGEGGGEMLVRMRLQGLEDRYPDQISGGQKQRVAIARAFMTKPRVLLLDEPFSALDGAVREQLRMDIRSVQRDMGLSAVYVTHSLEDAFAMGDRLAIINEGRLEQIGTMDDVFRRPWTANVARVLGTTNVFQVVVAEASPERLIAQWQGMLLDLPPQRCDIGERLTIYVRPEDVKILYPNRPLSEAVARNRVTGKIVRIIPHGASNLILFRADTRSDISSDPRSLISDASEYDLEIRYPSQAYRGLDLREGSSVTISVRKDAIHVVSSPRPSAVVADTDRGSRSDPKEERPSDPGLWQKLGNLIGTNRR